MFRLSDLAGMIRKHFIKVRPHLKMATHQSLRKNASALLSTSVLLDRGMCWKIMFKSSTSSVIIMSWRQSCLSKYVRALVVVIHIQFIKKFVHYDTQNSHMTEILRLVYHRTMVNGLLFHMTQPTSRSIIKAIACSKPTISEHWSKWKHNDAILDQCKQRGALCHIGLAKDRGGHLVNQPRLSFLISVEEQQLDIK